ncbi:hypothetical protein EBN88_27390, partial [Streptomyces triticirhizae]
APGDYARTGPPAGPPAPGRPGGHAPLPRPEPREVRLGGLVFLLALIAFAVGVAVSWTSQPLGSVLVIGSASALAVFGVGLLVSAFVGRLGLGTITAVLLTGVVMASASVLPDNITTSWESHRWRPDSPGAVLTGYELGSGEAELDLTGVDLAPGWTLATEVEAGAGQITVLVPYDVDLNVSVEIGVGAFTYQPLRGIGGNDDRDSWGGFGQERTLEYPAVVDATVPEGEAPEESDADGDPREVEAVAVENPRIELRLEMGVGHVQIERAGEEPRP